MRRVSDLRTVMALPFTVYVAHACVVLAYIDGMRSVPGRCGTGVCATRESIVPTA